MMKCCCLIVFIFCTIGVSNGGILSGICHSSNGTCGKKGVPCKETFGSDWTSNGKCCDDRPCCKFLKVPCVPETCPKGFNLLSNQTSSANCYYTNEATWNIAAGSCASTAGAYLWRPNTEQEANAVEKEFNLPQSRAVWTGANDIDNDGIFTFDIENGPLSFNDLPFGAESGTTNNVCVLITNSGTSWLWVKFSCTSVNRYICEYKLRVCP
ncbi:uncharacterized protein [Mytilus edulis]|uniref:uncharacterized protein n=1 Tax=Mytilus edulis TaxID=6550 RepID=UPI0039EED044